jgi:hypothetical protein
MTEPDSINSSYYKWYYVFAEQPMGMTDHFLRATHKFKHVWTDRILQGPAGAYIERGFNDEILAWMEATGFECWFEERMRSNDELLYYSDGSPVLVPRLVIVFHSDEDAVLFKVKWMIAK